MSVNVVASPLPSFPDSQQCWEEGAHEKLSVMWQKRKGTSVLLAWTTTPNGIVIAPGGKIPLEGKMKVEAHGGI